MQSQEVLVNKCIRQAELESLLGNDYMAELLNDCAKALCEADNE